MHLINADTRTGWTVGDLNGDPSWIHTIDDRGRRDLTQAVRLARDPAKTLFDYRRDDFDLGSAWPAIAGALQQIKDGTGFALLRGLPRDGFSAGEFELMTWVARPPHRGRAAAGQGQPVSFRCAGWQVVRPSYLRQGCPKLATAAQTSQARNANAK